MIGWLILLGICFAFFPILLAAIASLPKNVSIFDEGTGGGAYLLFLLITLPIGLIISCIGLFL